MTATAAATRRFDTERLIEVGFARSADGSYAIETHEVAWHGEGHFEPGWYRLSLKIRSTERFAVRKRLDFTVTDSDAPEKPILRERFEWNRQLRHRLLIQIPRRADRLTLTLHHGEGRLHFDDFRLKRIDERFLGLTAAMEKLGLLAAYRCVRPVLWRGAGYLVRGEFAKFRDKVLKGLSDSRTMRLGVHVASEVDASWWRHNALPAAEADVYRRAIDAMPSPPPISVLLPVLPKQFDRARAAAHSIRRQLYPHWQLHLACAGHPSLHTPLMLLIGRDPRVHVHLVDEDDGLPMAVGQALAALETDGAVVLPGDTELAEHALFHLATAIKERGGDKPLSLKLQDGSASEVRGESRDCGRVWYCPARRLTDDVPEKPNHATVAAWVEAGLAERGEALEPVLAYPVEETPILARARVEATDKPGPTTPLLLAADLRGITGWDHVTYAVLRGLPSAGVKLTRDPHALIRAELIPPNDLPGPGKRKKGQKVLAISPAFIVHRFNPTPDTAVWTMWETDRLTAADVKKLNAAGLILVPSRWQVDCFRTSGVTVPIEVVPLGYDPLIYHDDGSFPEICTFGTAGALVAGGMRKNAQKMVELFRRAFPTEADVRLRIKISPNSPPVETHDDPRIDLLRAVLPHAELAKWYRSLTAYLNGSFGEGFGLHLIEAMACGRPLITTNYSGLTGFYDPGLGYDVAYDLVPVENDVYTGRWAEPRDESIVSQLRAVYGDGEAARDRGSRSASRARQFTWKCAGRALIAALQKHGWLPGGPSIFD